MDFYIRNYKGVSGRQTRCKDCNSEVVRAWRKRSIERKIKQKFDSLCGGIK